MLQTNTVTTHTLELLKDICANPAFNDFYLVGGTGLALIIGHRISVDLDFFSNSAFDQNNLSEVLIQEFDATVSSIANNSLSVKTKPHKVDCLIITPSQNPLRLAGNKIF